MHTDLSRILDALLADSPAPLPADLAQWKAYYLADCAHLPAPWQAALVAGFHSGCVGFAFAAGYQSALRALAPGLENFGFGALCVTERGGNHPRAIEATLTASEDGFLLSGEKSFVTGGGQADTLLVAARAGEHGDGRPQLKMLRIAGDAPGVHIESMPPLAFVPEIDHAAVRFEAAACDPRQLLPGDGYGDYVKPFRTIEDIHVGLAVCAYLLRVSVSLQLPHSCAESVLAGISAHVAVAATDATSPAMHIAFAGVRAQLEQLLPALESAWSSADELSFRDWERDKALLDIAGKARMARTGAAWTRVGR